MNHLTEEELILDYYREHGDADQARVEQHLAGCAACRAERARLAGLLEVVETTPMPEPGPGFEREVWARLEPQLDAGRRRWTARLGLPQWALAAGLAALLAGAFVAGRFSGGALAPAPAPERQAATLSARVLHAAVGEHLDRSQLVLLELLNADADSAALLAAEPSRAADLVSANRLFRQSAEQAGDAGVAAILDDLERVLLEIANASADATAGERADLISRIGREDLLFRLRVVASELRQPVPRDRNPDDRGLRPLPAALTIVAAPWSSPIGVPSIKEQS